MIKGSALTSNVSTSGTKVYYLENTYILTGEWAIDSGILMLGAKSEGGFLTFWLNEYYICEYNKC